MLRKNLMNILLGLAAAGAVLVGYNAFIAKSEDGHTASNHLAEYLDLDVATLEKTEDQATNVVVDDGSENATSEVAVDNGKPAESEAMGSTKAEPTVTTTAPVTVQAGDKTQTMYTVKEGDTYGCIAEKYYGSYEHWTDVVSANPSSDGFTEYELHVGAQIVLPAVTSVNLKPVSVLCS